MNCYLDIRALCNEKSLQDLEQILAREIVKEIDDHVSAEILSNITNIKKSRFRLIDDDWEVSAYAEL